MQTFFSGDSTATAAVDGWTTGSRLSTSAADSEHGQYITVEDCMPQKRQYDPFGVVKLWAKSKPAKTPPLFIRCNAVPTKRPRKGRRGKK